MQYLTGHPPYPGPHLNNDVVVVRKQELDGLRERADELIAEASHMTLAVQRVLDTVSRVTNFEFS